MSEVAYSALEAARPLIRARDEFVLTYVQPGLLTTLPIFITTLVEPIIGLFADTGKRHLLLTGSGLLFGLGLLIQGVTVTFPAFMAGLILAAPAVGVFANLARASLMDDAPQQREHRMALWTFSDSLAVVVGPLLLPGLLWIGLNWRTFFLLAGLAAVLMALLILRLPASDALRSSDTTDDELFDIRQSLNNVRICWLRWNGAG